MTRRRADEAIEAVIDHYFGEGATDAALAFKVAGVLRAGPGLLPSAVHWAQGLGDYRADEITSPSRKPIRIRNR